MVSVGSDPDAGRERRLPPATGIAFYPRGRHRKARTPGNTGPCTLSTVGGRWPSLPAVGGYRHSLLSRRERGFIALRREAALERLTMILPAVSSLPRDQSCENTRLDEGQSQGGLGTGGHQDTRPSVRFEATTTRNESRGSHERIGRPPHDPHAQAHQALLRQAAGEPDRDSVMKFEDYPINIEPIPWDEGGGYMVTFPDLPGCIADGDTIDAAIAEARDAFDAWTRAELEDKGRVQSPKTYSGHFVQRIPRTLHRRLARRAASEGVSLNQLAATYLAQGLAIESSASPREDVREMTRPRSGDLSPRSRKELQERIPASAGMTETTTEVSSRHPRGSGNPRKTPSQGKLPTRRG